MCVGHKTIKWTMREEKNSLKMEKEYENIFDVKVKRLLHGRKPLWGGDRWVEENNEEG